MVTTRSSRSKTAGDKHAADASPRPAPVHKKTKTAPGKKKTAKETKTRGPSNASLKPTVEDVTDSEDARSRKHKKKPSTSHPKEEEPPQKRQRTASPEQDSKPAVADGKQESAKERAEAAEASPILEKGLVYFFLRGKVDIEHPENLDEVKRSYIVLRPIPMKKSIPSEEGEPVKDEGKARLIAIPKKRLPSKGYEKFLTFVEEPGAPPKEIAEKWLKGRTYMTKTVGERTDHPAQPIGEGVYAITKADDERQSHFAYMLTVPEKLGEIQDEFGLKQKGSFVVSVRNPNNPAPANAAVPDPAEYSKEIMEEFGGLKWGPLQPKHLEYKNAEILFIGEKQFPEEGAHEGTEQELSRLEYEDEERIKHLSDTDAVFADLEQSGKELGEFTTTWGE